MAGVLAPEDKLVPLLVDPYASKSRLGLLGEGEKKRAIRDLTAKRTEDTAHGIGGLSSVGFYALYPACDFGKLFLHTVELQLKWHIRLRESGK